VARLINGYKLYKVLDTLKKQINGGVWGRLSFDRSNVVDVW